jgi:regulator of protease activity HflC (stomatin/prohibitin superfamily)
MQRAMARQAEAEREKRAKIIAAQGEALAAGELAAASDVMMAHPVALQLRNLQTLVEVAVEASPPASSSDSTLARGRGRCRSQKHPLASA